METRTITTLEELALCARELLALLPPTSRATVIALSGDLGAGKTALTKMLAEALGIREDITSPTFVIMKSYAISPGQRFETLVHIDAYRIETIDEMRVLRFPELLDNPKNLIVIEWPERIAPLIPKDTFPVTITIREGETRTITYGT